MQNIGFVGKVYNMKTETDKKGNVSRVNLRLAVRKKFVTEEEKKANKYNVFVPFVAFGKTAELLDAHVQDGQVIGLSNCEYSTFEYEKNGDTVYGHNFKAGSLEFLPRGEEDEAPKKKASSTRSKSRRRDEEDDEDEDEEEEEAPRRRKKKPAAAPKKKRRPEPEEDEDDDDFEDDIDDDDVPF